MPEPAVSVVICTHRRPHLLPASVDAVLAQQVDVPFELIVVNDDDEPLRCRLPDDPRLRVLTAERRGLCAGRNAGILAARGALIALTDDDTLAPPDWLATVVAAMAAHPDALGVEGPLEYGRDVDRLYEHVPVTTNPGGFCGCNVAYRRDALIAAGLFDERFVAAGAEDIDLGLRVAALGPVIGEPSMVMVHPPRPISVLAQVLLARRSRTTGCCTSSIPSSRDGRPTAVGRDRLARARAVAHPARPRGDRRFSRRAVRAGVIGVGTIAVALVTACTRPFPSLEG